MFAIRPASAADVPTLRTMIQEFAEFERLPCVVTEESLMRDGFGKAPKFRVLMCEVEGKAAGYAFFFNIYSTFQGGAAIFLEDIYVRPEFRSLGIGKAFMARVAAIAREENCYGVRWEVLDWNQPAIDFYKKLGSSFLDDWKSVLLTGEPLERLAQEAR